MNKQLIQNILYAGHCIGICSDWSEQVITEIIDMLKDKEYVYNKSIIDEEKLDEQAIKSYNEPGYIGMDPMIWFTEGYKAGYRKAKED